MKLLRRTVFSLFIFLFLSEVIFAQEQDNVVVLPVTVSIPPISLVGFASSDAKLNNVTGKGAEQIITPSIVNKTWINYTSIVDGNSSNSISVNLNTRNLPAEVIIKLNIGNDVGAGAGKVGTPIGQITLSQYPQSIITDIGSCYTGLGAQKGHQLTYSWEWLPPYDVDHSSIDSLEVSVSYTLTAGK